MKIYLLVAIFILAAHKEVLGNAMPEHDVHFHVNMLGAGGNVPKQGLPNTERGLIERGEDYNQPSNQAGVDYSSSSCSDPPCFYSRTVKEGDEIKIMCPMSGRYIHWPELCTFWEPNGKLHSQRWEPSVRKEGRIALYYDANCYIRIRKVLPEDAGDWTCVVNNRNETATTHVEVVSTSTESGLNTGPGSEKIWQDNQCPNIGNQVYENLQICLKKCEDNPRCTAVNACPYGKNQLCIQRGCSLPVPTPTGTFSTCRGHVVKVSAKCDDVKNFNTKSFKKKYSAGLTRSWQGCRDKCWALKTCEHWIWQKSGECEYMKFEVRRPDSNTYTGTCKKQDQ